jgi:oxygen-independent coproporphyrinogen-3 oxidase
MAQEMELWREKFGVEKIYPTSMLIGGGTPTALSAQQLTLLFKALNSSLDFSKCAQITCETEPGSILGQSGLDKLKVLRDQGVERISLGVQAFDDLSLKEMGRVHSAGDAAEAIEQARKAGFKSVSIDLIYGYPGCTVERWLSTLETALDLEVDAFQLYRLRIVPHGDKAGNIKTKFEISPESFPSVEDLYIMKMLGFIIADKAGMNEASRRMFSKSPAHSSQYLLDHTDRLTDVIGFGASSWSNVQGRFYLNTGESLESYAGYIDKGRLPINRGRLRTRDDEARWAITLALKHNGLSKELFKGLLGMAVEEVFPRQLENLKKFGLIEDNGEKLHLTERGKFFADEVVMQFYHPNYLPFPESSYAATELNPFSYSLPSL